MSSLTQKLFYKFEQIINKVNHLKKSNHTISRNNFGVKATLISKLTPNYSQ